MRLVVRWCNNVRDALGLELIFTNNGPKFVNALNGKNNVVLDYKPHKLNYIYNNIKNIVKKKI